jgi:hypothetical protein
MSFNTRPLVMFTLLAGGLAGTAQAQLASPAQALLDNKFVFNLGAFVLGTDTSARLNGSSASNPDVDFDQTFGKASDATRIRADALWRITPEHHVRFMYFDNTVDRTRVIDRDIKWGDYTFRAGGNVDSRVGLKIAELAYEYAFVRQPTYEVAGSIGVHYMDVSLRLSGAATITDANGTIRDVQFAVKENSVPVPLPVIGIRGGWVVAPQIYLDAQAQFFKADIGSYNARVTDLRAGATWMFTRNFGVGLGYNRFVTTVDVNKESFDGHVKVGYSGLQLFATGTF